MVFSSLEKIGIVPVVVMDSTEQAIPLADTLLEAGLPVAEITFRTQASEEIIAKISEERPELLVGAGTVLTVDQVRSAKQAGAKFGLAPGLDPVVIQEAATCDLPFAPGIMTPSEIQAALRFGIKTMKFFPAQAAGGPGFLKNISSPFKHLDLQFIPTGGVNPDNLPDWLAVQAVKAVGGTWIATRDDIKNGNWAAIKEKAEKAVTIVQGHKE